MPGLRQVSPILLHGDLEKSNKQEIKPPERYSRVKPKIHVEAAFLSDSGMVSKCSMIVPVHVSHTDDPDNERLVYALLDTQSDTVLF